MTIPVLQPYSHYNFKFYFKQRRGERRGREIVYKNRTREGPYFNATAFPN